MENLVRGIPIRDLPGEEAGRVLSREWLITNGLGGYASATVGGTVTWRYHGLLIAALPAPLGRVVMFNHLAETLWLNTNEARALATEEAAPRDAATKNPHYLVEFRLENQSPIWTYDIDGMVLEKSILLVQGQNTVHINYRLLRGEGRFRIDLRPSFHFRRHEQSVSERITDDYLFSAQGERYHVSAGESWPTLRMVLRGDSRLFTHDGGGRREVVYQRDADRGYDSRGILWSPGFFSAQISAEKAVTLMASTEPWSAMLALRPEAALEYCHRRAWRLRENAAANAAKGDPAETLVLAADQFIVEPVGRAQDSARARAAGDEIRTVIAGYHWFTDWGRDTMISLEGLTLVTRRFVEAGWILRAFAHYVRNGLIPNLFPEGECAGLYHTADAALWFFHAVGRYVDYTNDRVTLRQILPRLIDIADHHLRGTEFGIGVDPRDGLLRQGAEGYQLTWMDAKVDGWVVTPRRGKAVEINGLWYNALCLLVEWLRDEGSSSAAEKYEAHAKQARQSFNEKFWCAERGYLYDVVEGLSGADSACRPNQLFSFSLKYPALDSKYWEPVLETARQRLLTPFGLRSLSSDHPDYQPKYFGDLRARDAAYHQGTVWAWLMGPFIDCWLKVHPGDKAGARKFLGEHQRLLSEGCVGSVNEIFDAEPPFTPRGCIAQAWSVAEWLRSWVKTEA